VAVYFGDGSFKDHLLDFFGSMAKGSGKPTNRSNLSGAAIRDQDELEAERLILRISAELGIDSTPGNLAGRGRFLKQKAILAWFVKSRTGVSNEWVSKRLATGHPSGVSKAVRRVTDDPRLLRQAKRLAKAEEKAEG